jgi:hypothetical protein
MNSETPLNDGVDIPDPFGQQSGGDVDKDTSPEVQSGSLDSRMGAQEGSNLDKVIKDQDPDAFVADIRENLGMISGLLHDRRMQRIQRRQAIMMAKVLYKAQYEALVQRVMLGLDISNKRLFVEYMRSNKVLQDDLQTLSGETVNGMTDLFLDVRVNTYDSALEQEQKIKTAVIRGSLTERQGNDERALIERLRSENLGLAQQTFETLRSNHMGLLERTLTLFKEDLVRRNLLV